MELTMHAWLFHEHAFTISTNICKNEMINVMYGRTYTRTRRARDIRRAVARAANAGAEGAAVTTDMHQGHGAMGG